MNLRKYNNTEIAVMRTIRDQFKWYLGEELGFDPQKDAEAMMELEMRFAKWLLDGGGEWLRNLPAVHEIIEE